MAEINLIKPIPKPRASKLLNNSVNSSNSDQNSTDSLNAKTADSQSISSLNDSKIIEVKDDESLSPIRDESRLTFRDQNVRNSDLMWFASGIDPKNLNIEAASNLYPDWSNFYHDPNFNDQSLNKILERPDNLELSCAQVDEAFEQILGLNDDNNENNFKLEFNEADVAVAACDTATTPKKLEKSTPIDDKPVLPAIMTKLARSPISVPHSVLGAPDAANVCFVGWLTVFKMNNIRKNEYIRRWCVLHDGMLIFFNDETDEKALDTIDCKSILFVNAKNSELSSPNNGPADPLFSFDLYYLSSNNQKVDHLQLLADSDEDRCVWITFLSRCLIASDASEMCQKVDRAGSVFLKKGTTADWECGWMIMIKSTLLYSCENDQCSYEIDVRKIIRLKVVDDPAECRRFSKSASSFVIATEGSSLYIQTKFAAITEAWKNALQSMLCVQRTSMISDQRLTFDDIPVIVEKCVNFIAVHGINIEGIHRLSGTASKVKQLFDDFQRDPYSVHLRIEDYCVHDVASVLRKFLRQLKEPLITADLRSSFIEASCVQEAGTRHLQCKLLLRQLPLINYRTLRKILSHLKNVADNCQTNMMNVQNLSAIFGPTLFTVDRDDIEGMNFTSTSQAILLTADMILYFNWLFDVEEAELAKEIIIQQVAKDLTQHQTKKKLAGELLFSIYTDHRDGACFNMQITKKLMASEVGRFAVERNKVNFASVDDIGLFEVVCRGELERLISPDENVLDVVSRWTTWSLEERASNYLILKSDYVTNHVKDMAFGQTLYPTCEVFFAENRSFKKCFFKYVQGTIAQLKDAKSTKHLKEWNCDDLLWYFGCEVKRQPPKKFNLTFITKSDLIKRSKTTPFFGQTMCFKTEKDLYKWLCTVLLINVNIPF